MWFLRNSLVHPPIFRQLPGQCSGLLWPGFTETATTGVLTGELLVLPVLAGRWSWS